MSKANLNREFITTVKPTEWWVAFLSELIRRRNDAARLALTATEPIDIYRAQGRYRALNSLIDTLEEPLITENGTFVRGATELD